MSKPPLNYQALKVFCSRHREEIEKVVGRKIRCQDKAVVLREYYDLLQEPLPQKRTPKIESTTVTGGEKDSTGPYLIGGKYRLGKQLGKGGFGVVYKGEDVTADKKDSKIAIKVAEEWKKQDALKQELLFLKELQKVNGIPKLLSPTLVATNDGTGIVMELLGPTLSDVGVTVTSLPLFAAQMLTILEKVHERRIINRDIKPSNWLFGIGKNKGKLYLIDFGVATFYRNRDGSHAELRTDAPFRGTHKYASANAEAKIEQSRRDDLISLGYSLASFFTTLVWGKLYVGYKEKKATEKKKILKRARELKESLVGICPSSDTGVPASICNYLERVLKLDFAEDPDYDELRSYFE